MGEFSKSGDMRAVVGGGVRSATMPAQSKLKSALYRRPNKAAHSHVCDGATNNQSLPRTQPTRHITFAAPIDAANLTLLEMCLTLTQILTELPDLSLQSYLQGNYPPTSVNWSF